MRTRVAAALALVCGVSVACAPERPARIRNVVLVSLDAVGALHVGAYGYERDTTPVIDRLAAEGTLFENAYTQQVWTLTSHITMLTGLYPKTHGAGTRKMSSPDARSLAELLRVQGFDTAAFTGVGGYASTIYGLGRGFDVFRTGKRDARRDNPPRIRWIDDWARRARDTPERRFFLFAHYYDAHSDVDTDVPYDSPPAYRFRYLPDGLDWDKRGATDLLIQLQSGGQVEDRDREVLTALYDASVRFTDEVALGGLLEALRRAGVLDETLVVVTSDHGEEMFEHGAGTHQQPYEQTARVPFVLWGPGIPAGLRISDPVQLIDLAPTILSLLGLAAPEAMQGRDLSPLLRGTPLPPAPAFVDGIFGAHPPFLGHFQSSVILPQEGRRWSFIDRVEIREQDGGRVFETAGEGELYDLVADPGQQNDLAQDQPELARELAALLESWYAETDAAAARLAPPPKVEVELTRQQRERLRALGYAE